MSRISEGDIVRYKDDSGSSCVDGRVIFTSKIFKDVVAVAIPKVDGGDLVIYSSWRGFQRAGFSRVAAGSLLPGDDKLTLRRIGFEVYLRDDVVTGYLADSFTSMRILGYYLIQLKMREAFGQ